MCVGGSIGEEDSIVGIDKGVMVVQSALVPGMVLTVPMFLAEELTLKGVSMCIVHLNARLELVECMRTSVGVHQQSQQCVALLGDGYTEGSGELSDKRRVEGYVVDSQGRGLTCRRGSLSHQ